MTVKGFFKSTVFKCIVTLLCVLLISGVFLTVMNGLLEVTPEERLQRAINKIYGQSVGYKAVAVANYNDNATIEEAYKIEDGNYLVKSTGKGGYENGTVTCWVVVEYKGGAVTGIGKVVIDSNKGQSYIDRVTDKALNQFSELYVNEIKYNAGMITNATVSGTKTAICNAVNGALDYVNYSFGQVRAEGERFLEDVQKAYGDYDIAVYGTDEKGAEKQITKEDETVKGFAVNAKYGNATINEYYKVLYNDGEKDIVHYLISSTGINGYENGTVTLRIAIAIADGKPSTIHNVVITDNTKQTFVDDGKITHLDKYQGVDISEDGFAFATTENKDDYNGFVSTGATRSSRAINNAINGAITYIKTLNFEPEEGEETPDTEEGGAENE
ncbi:MAG: hypothetical protein HDQ88_05190 [Clostridia bacterium]|nr:hypothetical protein [Clostridia bacterium]